MSHSCNEYIIKNGEYLRDFEGMYRSEKDPWSHISNGVSTETLSLVEKLSINRYDKVLDVGAGLGAQSKAIIERLGLNHAQYIGTDISSTCVDKARSFGFDFFCDDLRVTNTDFKDSFDLIIAIKILYYCAPEIDQTLSNIRDYLRSGGVLAYIYNETPDSFSMRWLSLKVLREKLEKHFTLQYSEEKKSGIEITAVDIWKINDC